MIVISFSSNPKSSERTVCMCDSVEIVSTRSDVVKKHRSVQDTDA